MAKRVKIYIETSSQIGRIRQGAYVYILEYIKKNGEPFTKEGKKVMLDATKDRLTLMAMVEALDRISDTEAEIVFIPSDKGVLYAIQNGWPQRWKANGWKGSKGMIKNMDLWEWYLSSAEGRNIRLSDEHNSYKAVMRNEIKKIEEVQKDAYDRQRDSQVV